jgi:subtilisin
VPVSQIYLLALFSLIESPMKTIRLTLLLALGSALLVTSCKKETTVSSVPLTQGPDECVVGTSARNGDIIPGQYIIGYNEGSVSRTAGVAAMETMGENVLERNHISEGKMKKVFGGARGGFVALLNDEELQRLRTDPAVDIVEPDRIVALGNCFTVAEPRLITWNIDRVGYGDGRGKRAWIIDSGIDMDHPDLTVDATKSRSFITGVSSPDDEHGHGTHVAGIIGGNNNTIGVLGVASGATLVSLRVLNAEGNGTVSSIIQALAYVNANASAGDVVNMSLGEEITSAVLNQEVQNTANRGIYIAIAAGNKSEPANKYSPANTNGANIYTVSAIDSLDRFAAFSNYGNDVVDFAAPGVKILSTYSQGRYAYLSGTSMAAPHVAGLLLLKGRSISSSGTAKNDPDGVADAIAHY